MMWLLVLHQSWGFWYFNAVTVLCAVLWCQVNSVQSNITLHSVNISLSSVSPWSKSPHYTPHHTLFEPRRLESWTLLTVMVVTVTSSQFIVRLTPNMTWPWYSISCEGQPTMSICQKLQIEQYSSWLSSSLSSVKLLVTIRNYVMPLDETDNIKNDETGFCSKVRGHQDTT